MRMFGQGLAKELADLDLARRQAKITYAGRQDDTHLAGSARTFAEKHEAL